MDVLVYWRVSFHGWDDFLHEESHVHRRNSVALRPWMWLKNVVFQDRS